MTINTFNSIEVITITFNYNRKFDTVSKYLYNMSHETQTTISNLSYV